MELWELAAREAVRDTVAAYTHAGDRGRNDELAACFTDDGILELGNGTIAAEGTEAKGRAAIAALLQQVPGNTADTRPAHGFVRHFVANLRFESVSPERIMCAAYFLVVTRQGLDHWGRYRDVFVPVGERWLIAHRRATMDARADASFLTSS